MRAIFKTVVEIESSLRAAGVRAADAMVLAARTRPYIWLETTPLGDETEIAFGATKDRGERQTFRSRCYGLAVLPIPTMSSGSKRRRLGRTLQPV
jgi:hypothetical protein